MNNNNYNNIVNEINNRIRNNQRDISRFETKIKNTKDIIEKDVDEKYFFSNKAVEGMKKSHKKMNKGRVQKLNEPCNTVGSHLAKVSLNSTDPVLYINDKYRRFTPREVARIQSFPENFILCGSESAQYRALGNAIPPVLSWFVTDQLVNILKEER